MKATRSTGPTQAIGLVRHTSRLSNYWAILILCALGAFALLWRLGKGSLDDWDEAIYAQVSKEIVQGGDWLTLHCEYEPWFEKPPLYIWSTAIFYRLFGVSEFWSRAASAFSGIGLLIITYLIGRLIYDKTVGFFATLILLTSYQFVFASRFGTTDIILALLVFVAVYAYLSLESGDQNWWYAIWVSFALAVMVKSAIGLMIPAIVTLALLLENRVSAAIRSRHFWTGLLCAFVIAAPWHMIMILKHGRAFVDEYIGYHIVARSVHALELNTGGRLFYVDRLRENFFPWFYLVPFVLALGIRENIKSPSRSRILLLIITLVFGLFTVARTKIYWYIVPLYPALAIMVASTARQALRSYESMAFGGLVVAALMVALIAPREIVLIFGCIGLLTVILCLTKKIAPYQPAAVVMCAFLVIAGINGIRPLYQMQETSVAKLARIAASTGPNDREPMITLSPVYGPTPRFYSDRPVQEAYSLEDLAAFTSEHQAKRIILAREDMEFLATDYEMHALAEDESLVLATIRSVRE